MGANGVSSGTRNMMAGAAASRPERQLSADRTPEASLAKLANVSYSASTSPGSGEQIAAIGNLELCYATFGEHSDPALVLITGLATQMIGWRIDFCESLAARGFLVVRCDNRDGGRSTRLDDLPVPTFWQLARRDARPASATLEDM